MSNITEAVQPYLSPNESIRAARANDSSAVVVTDRRIMEVTQGSGDAGRDLKLAKSTLLKGPKVLGVKIVEAESEPVDTDGVIYGVGSFLVGFALYVIFNGVSGELAEAAGLMSALAGSVMGLLLIWGAIQTKDGKVTVELIGDEGEVIETISLAEEEADVAAEISSVIGE